MILIRVTFSTRVKLSFYGLGLSNAQSYTLIYNVSFQLMFTVLLFLVCFCIIFDESSMDCIARCHGSLARILYTQLTIVGRG